MVLTAMLGHQPHPFAGEALECLDLSRIDGVVHDAGDHGTTIRATRGRRIDAGRAACTANWVACDDGGMDVDHGDVSIRAGDERDVAAVVGLMDGAVAWLIEEGRTGQWGSEPYSANPRSTAAISSMAADRGLYLAVSTDIVVGAVAVGSAPDCVPAVAEPELYVRLLVTDRTRAGRGIGGRLLEHARVIARTVGVELLRVDCYAGPDRALIRYYEKQGFTATETFEVARPSGPWPGQVLQQRLSRT